MLIFDNNHTVGNTTCQKIFHRFCHRRDRFSGPNYPNSIIVIQVKTAVADKKKIFILSGVTLDGFHRIDRLQPGLENLHSVRAHFCDI